MSKSNRSIYQSIYKDIHKGFSRIYWWVYTSLKYKFYTYKFLYNKGKVNDPGISILVPTKNRADKFNKMFESLINTRSINFKVEILILFDEYEKEQNLYFDTINKYNKKVNVYFFNKNFKKNSERINFLASKSNFEIILLINDDLKFRLNNWNEVICYEFSKVDINKPFSLWLGTDDVKYKYFHSNFPVINKSWYNKLGYHSPSKYFQHWWSDNWICDLGKKSGKFLISDKIFFTHFNQFQKNQLDSLYIENEKKRDGKKDYENWIKLDKIRRIDANKL